jgi:hypothetical protein
MAEQDGLQIRRRFADQILRQQHTAVECEPVFAQGPLVVGAGRDIGEGALRNDLFRLGFEIVEMAIFKARSPDGAG